LKLTYSKDEATLCASTQGQIFKHFAKIYEVYRLPKEDEQHTVYLIIKEYIKDELTEEEKNIVCQCASMWKRINWDNKGDFEYWYKISQEDCYELSHNPMPKNQYDKVKFIYNQIDSLKKEVEKATDIHGDNFGWRDGNLVCFDAETTDSKTIYVFELLNI
jgi:hypothetical protein